METFKSASRGDYEAVQIQASTAKMSYCKFSYGDAQKYVDLIRRDKTLRGESPDLGPIVALGVRNGREVDCFRVAKHGTSLRRWLVGALERRYRGFAPRVPLLESFGRNPQGSIERNDCVGVELNPNVTHPDVWVGSFDQLPESWSRRFGVAYTNAFDHAYDPEVAAACWRRILRPNGYLVLCFPTDQDAAAIDPVGKVSLDDVRQLFPGELVHYQLRGSGWFYTEHIIRMPA